MVDEARRHRLVDVDVEVYCGTCVRRQLTDRRRAYVAEQVLVRQ